MLFVVLTCATKLSLWAWWQRFVFSALLAGFVWRSEQYAVLQSKTQLADLLQNTEALQNIAVLVTIETAFNFGFCVYWFTSAYDKKESVKHRSRAVLATFLKYYPSLLIFPVMFYVLTQTIFTAVGVDFGLSTMAVAIATLLLLPLLAEGMKWVVRDAEGRVETLLVLSCLVCVLGLATTVTSKMIYRSNETPTDWKMVSLAIGIFAILFAAGYFGSKLKWHFKKNDLTTK